MEKKQQQGIQVHSSAYCSSATLTIQINTFGCNSAWNVFTCLRLRNCKWTLMTCCTICPPCKSRSRQTPQRRWRSGATRRTKQKIDLGSWSHPIIFSCSSSKHHWQHRPGTDGLASAKKTHDFAYFPSFLPSDPMTPKPLPTLVIYTLYRLTHSQLNPVRRTATQICRVIFPIKIHCHSNTEAFLHQVLPIRQQVLSH